VKIVLVSSSYPPTLSGVSIVVHTLAKLLANKHQVVVLVANNSLQTSIQHPQSNLTIYRLPAIPNPLRTNHFIPLPSPQTTSNILHQISPHLLHLHDPSPLSLSTLPFAKKHHLPLIITHHFTSELVFSSFKLTRNLTTSSSPTILKALIPLYNRFDTIIVPSQTILHQLQPLLKTTTVHIPNGVDTQHFKPQNTTPNTDLIYIGRFDPEKNLPLLIQTFQGISTQLPLTLTLVGSGTQTTTLKTMAKSNSHISFVSQQPHSQLPQIYRSTRIFVTPSTSENNPLSVLEALACGLPVIAPQAGGIPDLIQHQFNGLLVTPNHSISLASAITRLALDQTLYRQLTINARKSALQFSLSKFLQRHLKLYHQLKRSK